ncbi:NAD(P)H-dependent oxidoreductase [Pedobacter sp. Leaf194]|uniref:NAD(P)H-dependent oxidoreductase n=1 Tax=Pedobacter sp. Leaf194 TaxID=1736297 RepID=UPI0007037CA7|nr:NAD(P)H-dependent oxidoreductase [Pedobacter sp. Leaf194]KQS36803.1 NAD(P)H dehydrogenase [Pedobacter sp. Leaf194]
MKYLIIFAHPDPQSLNGHLERTLFGYLGNKGQEIVVRDLYQLNFNPVLSVEDIQGQREGKVAEDVKLEQEFISWADHITFIYPIWWTGMPAILKGFIDRVFSYGFAYRYDQGKQKGLLTGKQTTIINTHGKSQSEYEEIGMDKALSLTSDRGIFSYCGLEINRHFFFDRADRPAPQSVENWKSQILSTYT